jgi:uncharacterized protein (TIGR02145 family)
MLSKFNIVLIIVVITSLNTLALNYPPKIENVRFTQRTDGTFFVDIYYSLFDGDTVAVTMLASNNGGETFDFLAISLTGDVGDSVVPGYKKHIVWDFAKDHPNYSCDQIQIKIIADDHATLAAPCPEIPTVTYEGVTYNTVQIDDQCWLKENLNVGTMVRSDSAANDQLDNGIIEKYCYDNNEANCDKYGGLYQWDEAMKYTTTEGARGICPPGWHIPTMSEFETLSHSVSGLKNPILERGQNNKDDDRTNLSGFSALFTGYRSKDNGTFSGIGKYTLWFSSTEGGYFVDNRYRDAATRLLRYDDYVIDYIVYSKKYGYNIRCLKDN